VVGAWFAVPRLAVPWLAVAVPDRG
jgi:hypothetical protein